MARDKTGAGRGRSTPVRRAGGRDGTNAEPRRTFDSERFAQQAEVLDIVLDHIKQGMVVIGGDYRTLAFNKYFEDLFQLPPGTVEVGVDFRDILRAWARETGQDDAMLARAIAELDAVEPFEFEFQQDIHGDPRWCLLTHNPIPGKGFVRTFTDITERKSLEEQLRQLSLTDELTGLSNRRAILDVLDQELVRQARYAHPLSLLSLDIDHFKRVNDTWGHQAGDIVLQGFGAECVAATRKTDRIGRVGGEEFLIVLPETGIDEALQLAERLRVAVAAWQIPVTAGCAPLRVTVSAGLAKARERDQVQDLVQRADAALYSAKAGGRNRVVVAA